MNELYLEDFTVGRRFTSTAHTLDAEQIKAFARQFDPQPFHTDEEAASPCRCWSKAACPSPAA
jgi:acyl dehydratase